MRDGKRSESTIFSDAAKKMRWLKKPWLESLFKYLPQWLTLAIFILFSGLWFFFDWPDYAKMNVNLTEYCINAGEFFQFNLLTLHANAVLIVLVGTITYFCKNELVTFSKTADIINNVQVAVRNLDVNIKFIVRQHLPHVNVRRLNPSEHMVKEFFILDSMRDFEILDHANRVLRKFIRKAYLFCGICILLTTSWAVLDIPLSVLTRFSNTWLKYRMSIGISLTFLFYAYILLYAILYLVTVVSGYRFSEVR